MYICTQLCARQPANTPEQHHEPSPRPHLIMCTARHVRSHLVYRTLIQLPPADRPTRPARDRGRELSAVQTASARAARLMHSPPPLPLRRHPQQRGRDALPSSAAYLPPSPHARPLTAHGVSIMCVASGSSLHDKRASLCCLLIPHCEPLPIHRTRLCTMSPCPACERPLLSQPRGRSANLPCLSGLSALQSDVTSSTQ